MLDHVYNLSKMIIFDFQDTVIFNRFERTRTGIFGPKITALTKKGSWKTDDFEKLVYKFGQLWSKVVDFSRK